AVACDGAGRNGGLAGFLGALAALAVSGVAVDVDFLFRGRDARELDLTRPLAETPRTAWLVDGHTARPLVGAPPKGALVARVTPVVTAPAQAKAPQAENSEVGTVGREALVLE